VELELFWSGVVVHGREVYPCANGESLLFGVPVVLGGLGVFCCLGVVFCVFINDLKTLVEQKNELIRVSWSLS